MSKFKVGNPWKTGKTNSERKGICPTDREALKRRDRGSLMKEITPIESIRGRNTPYKNQETTQPLSPQEETRRHFKGKSNNEVNSLQT
jgi:hypothetical protein